MKGFKALVMILLLATAFSAFASGEQDSTDEPVKMTAFIGESMPEYDENATRVGQAITEATGIEVDMEFLVGDLETKAGIMIASGQYPDFINGRTEHHLFKDSGALIPLEDLIEEHAPNLKAMLGEFWPMMFEADGHIYAIPDEIPRFNEKTPKPPKGMLIQKAVLKEFGWPEVKSWDDYWNLIEAYKNKYPEINGQATIGYSPLTYDWYWSYFYDLVIPLSFEYPADGAVIVEPNGNGTWQARTHLIDETTKEYYRALNDLYNRGLIDKEGFVNTLDQHKARLSSGAVLACSEDEWIIQDVLDYQKANDPDRLFVYLPISMDGGDDAWFVPPSFAAGMGMSISTSCKDPVAAIKYLDYLATDEAQILTAWGEEGTDYFVDENGRYYRNEEQNELFADRNNDFWFPDWGGYYYSKYWPAYYGLLPNGNSQNFGNQPEIFFTDISEAEQEVMDAYGWNTLSDAFSSADQFNDRASYYPSWAIEAQPGTVPYEVEGRINSVIRAKYVPLMIMAENDAAFEDAWNNCLAELQALDLETYVGFYTDEINAKAAKSAAE